MPWNEPGKDKDPWGQRNNDAPPDLDEVFKNLKKKLNGLLGSGKGGNGSNGSSSGGSEDYSGIIMIAVGALAVVWLLSGIYIVDEGKRGVETRFGAKTDMTMPGPHWRLPWPIDEVEQVNVEGIRKVNHNSQMLTEDENIVALSLEVQYNVKNAQDYAFEVRDPDITLKQVAETAVREVVGRSTMDFVITDGRAVVSSETKRIMQDILDSYQTGLNVLQVNLNEAQPPEEVQDAFADAIKAREDEQRIINEANAYRNDVVPKARGDAQGMLEDAEAYRTRVTKSSEGETQRFSKLLAEYQLAPEVTRERLYLDAMEEVMANNSKVVMDTQNSGNLMYLPLDKLMSGSGGSSMNSGLPTSNLGATSNTRNVLEEFNRNTSRSRVRETR
ncbi:MAG: FtsH protease activity modulator HflK [Gammaproteobacteria bacterium]|jgi:membrane protease subunit HflK|nr:FtsH protease activity modulator HflK [Gammaproteobacteria bacterium]MBT4076750.1 FtsH protease activity modulator HflK [Gammaproteobacteria bacterium]MBT4450337.1 FtsH protease activity modulator HflK [Gammaproteobacteria bacterium]MBT6551132.1 FtsH protease activity modulator HflK [Gammaproteobacteria bacterium]MBT6703138.1 FtsH protease activity modulator HflK [Gammaproteobacteria bacterium]